MRTDRRITRLAGAAAAALALGASAAPSTAAGGYPQRADKACAAAGAKIERLASSLTPSVISREISIVTTLVRQLKAITPPASRAKKYKTFIAETETQVVNVKAALAAARRGDAAGVDSALKKVAAAGHASDATARALGLAACAKDYEARGR